IAAIVALGVWSAWRLRGFGGVSQRIISHNYDSVIASQDMKESLERMDSAALFLLSGDREGAMKQFNEHHARFDAAFENAARNITEPGESEIIEAIRGDRDEYYQRFKAFIDEGEKRRPGEYFQRLEPQFNKIRAELNQLLQLNQHAMLSKADVAAGAARREFLYTLALAGALGTAGLALALLLAHEIVRPVRALTAAAAYMSARD